MEQKISKVDPKAEEAPHEEAARPAFRRLAILTDHGWVDGAVLSDESAEAAVDLVNESLHKLARTATQSEVEQADS